MNLIKTCIYEMDEIFIFGKSGGLGYQLRGGDAFDV